MKSMKLPDNVSRKLYKILFNPLKGLPGIVLIANGMIIAGAYAANPNFSVTYECRARVYWTRTTWCVVSSVSLS